MQNVIISPTSEIIERLKRAQGYASDADLARDLGVPPKKLAVWKLRNTLPTEVLTSFCRQFGYTLEWVLTGEEWGAARVKGAATRMKPHDKRSRKLAAMLERILTEGDEKKIKAVESQLDAFDPGETKE